MLSGGDKKVEYEWAKKESVVELKDSAEQGFADAQYQLGKIYEYGEGVPQNYNKAAEWYKKAAEQEYSPAQKRLDVICRENPEACK